MVSRSLEKMLLIAIGLTTVVLVGVPVLFYTMNIISNASQIETAQRFAVELHNETAQVDDGSLDEVVTSIMVPYGIEVSASGYTLLISFQADNGEQYAWSEVYTHTINLTPPEEAGMQFVEIKLNGDELDITFTTAL